MIPESPLKMSLHACRVCTIALYAALGEKLESNKRGVVLALHESVSRTPQTVIPTQVETSRHACVTF